MYATQIDVEEAKARLTELVAEAASTGRGVLLTNAGRPIAILSAVPEPAPGGQPMPGLFANEPYWMSDDFDAELPDEFWLGEDA